MSVAVDVNVLVSAANERDERSAKARALLDLLLEGPDLFYLFWPVLFGYLRITTDPRIFDRPRAPADILANIATMLAQPHVRAPGEDRGFLETYRATATDQTRGNLVPDAHIAALMRQHGVRRIYTRDRDFRRFDGIEPVDPFV